MPARDRGGVQLHSAQVRMRRPILGVDRERERLDGREMEVGHLPRVTLSVFDSPDVDPVGAIRD